MGIVNALQDPKSKDHYNQSDADLQVLSYEKVKKEIDRIDFMERGSQTT